MAGMATSKMTTSINTEKVAAELFGKKWNLLSRLPEEKS